MPGVNGGQPGDLLLKVTVGTRPGFERKGADVYSTVYVPFATAALGGEAMVQTIHGPVICKIKEGTQSGDQDSSKRQGDCFHERSFKEGRPLCNCGDPGSGCFKPAGERKIKRISGCSAPGRAEKPWCSLIAPWLWSSARRNAAVMQGLDWDALTFGRQKGDNSRKCLTREERKHKIKSIRYRMEENG